MGGVQAETSNKSPWMPRRVHTCMGRSGAFGSDISDAPDKAADIVQLRLEAFHHARERNDLADMMRAGEPSYAALDTHPEAGVRHRTIAAQIEVPVERLQRQILRENLVLEGFIVVFALAAADDLAMAFRRKHINA